MDKNLDRYFELEEKVISNTINSIELEEWKTLNKGMMSNSRIEDTLRNDDVNASRLHVKMKLDAAFEEKFGSDNQYKDVHQNNVNPFPNKIRQLWAPPVNWAALASVAAVFVVFFMLRPGPSFEGNTVLLADSSLHYGTDTTIFKPDSILY
jgi:hypothetical protein